MSEDLGETTSDVASSSFLDGLKTLGASFGRTMVDGLRFRSWWKGALVYGGAAAAGIGAIAGVSAIVRARTPEKSFEDKLVLITGGARGLGKIIARLLLEEGASVVIWDIDYGATDQTVRAFQALHRGRVWGFRVDVSDHVKVHRAYLQMTERVGGRKVDVLINNATIHRPAPLLECSERDVRDVMRTNAMSHFWTIREFLPDMIEKDQGHIVCIASMAALAGVAGLQTYCASKFAVQGLTESVRMSLKKDGHNVDVTIVCPYYMKGPRFQGVKSPIMSLLEPEAVAAEIVRGMKRRREVICIPNHLRMLTYGARLFAAPATADWLQDVLGVTQSNDEVEFVPDDGEVEAEPLVGGKVGGG